MAGIKQTGDPATMQTAAGFPELHGMETNYIFGKDEIETLRELAKRVAEIAELDIQKEKSKLWTLHNDLKINTPLVFIDPENGWNECIPAETLKCRDPLARVWEMYLKKQIYWFEVLKDDKVIEPYFDVPYSYTTTGWGVNLEKLGGEKGGAYIVKQAIEDYEEDFEKIHFPKIKINLDESNRVLSLANDVFGDILKVRRKNTWYWTLGLTWDFINLRGLEDFMCDLLIEPEYVHRLMNLLCEGTIAKLDYLIENGLIAQNLDGTYVGSGGFGFTEELSHKDNFTTMDMWGFVESQETTAISPEMYGEFVFPYHKRIAEKFGLNCYGCCEPFDTRWSYVKELPRLRRVSCSPWSSQEKLSEILSNKYISSIKVSPTPLSLKEISEEEVRKDLNRALHGNEDCIIELIMKDNHTLGRNPRNASRWVEIAREEIEKRY